MVCVDDLTIRGSSQGHLVSKLAEVPRRLHEVGLFVAMHKCRCPKPIEKKCGKTYSDRGVEHEPERVQELTETRDQKSVGNLIKLQQVSD